MGDIPIPAERIERAILFLRGQKVMLDRDLAALYGVSVKVLNQAVARNRDRFPGDFMFRLSSDEAGNLRSQLVTSSRAWGGRRYPPYAFTETPPDPPRRKIGFDVHEAPGRYYIPLRPGDSANAGDNERA